MKRIYILLSFLFFLLLTLIPTGRAQTIVLGDATGLRASWGYPNPYTCVPRGPGYCRASLLFDTLVWKDQKGTIPFLAEKWSYNEKENSWTFLIREGILWHDGKPLTARDVAFTFRYIIKYPVPFYGKVSCLIKDVQVKGRKVTVYLKGPNPDFIGHYVGTMLIIPEHIWKGVGDPYHFTAPRSFIGTGPFILEEYHKGEDLYIYRANHDYFMGKPKFEKVIFKKVPDQHQALINGEIDMARINGKMIPRMQENGLKVISGPSYWNLKLLFNTRKGPFTHQKARQAIAYAIDREAMVKIVKMGFAKKGNPNFLPDDNPWYCPSSNQYPYRPEMTRRLIRKANLPTEITMIASSRFRKDAEFVQKALKGVGLKVKVRFYDLNTADALIMKDNFDLAITGHGGLGGAPSMMVKFITQKVTYSARFEDAQLKALLKKVERLRDKEERRKVMCKFQEVYAEKLPALTLYYPTWYYAFSDKAEFYLTPGGVAFGIPLPLNKLIFVERKQ
ncbi:MAG: ABC transporter substrate-binding protein [Deltaproteobacteria bacterium]|nr:ABC transporter substrate-binding protein [Deltaproteobacteria bacterium]